MKLAKTIRLNGVTIPKGTVLNFGTEGYAQVGKVRIAKSQIPEAAVEHVSQRRTGMKLQRTIRLGNQTIKAGTMLNFGTEGYANIAGTRIHKDQIPAEAFVAKENLSPVKLKMSCAVNGKIIPAKETLMFDHNGMAAFEGMQVSIYDIPTAAIEMDAQYQAAHNALDGDKTIKAFDAIEPGDMGFGQDGSPIRFLGKATGKSGYDALVGQFGNVSTHTFEEITAGMSDEEIDALQFVAYSTKDESVEVGRYGVDYASATEADDGEILDISEVQSGDKAINYDGKPCTIVAKGQGKVWHDNMVDTLGIDNCLSDIRKALGLDDDDNMQTVWFVLVTNDKNEKCVCHYGANGVRVIKNED